jgi:hypothetical protein
MSLAALCQLTREACEIDPDDDSQEAEANRQASDLSTHLGVKWLAENKPAPAGRRPKALRQYVRGNVKRIKAEAQAGQEHSADGEKLCGFFLLLIILGAILSWLIGKALDSLWEDYKNRTNAMTEYALMACEAPVAALGAMPCVYMSEADDLPDEFGEED